MKILVTGAAGMLGRDLVPVLAQSHRVKGVDLENFDVTDRIAVSGFIHAERPEVVIHAAAYTDVDTAESDPDTAVAVNGRGAENVAAACQAYFEELLIQWVRNCINETGIRGHRELDIFLQPFVFLLNDGYSLTDLIKGEKRLSPIKIDVTFFC